MFTKKTFIATAKIVHKLPVKERKSTAERFARQYAKDNPRFDKSKFMKACGV